MINTAQCIMFWMRAYPLLGEVGGGWALEFESFFSPVKWHRFDRRLPFGAQKTWDCRIASGKEASVSDDMRVILEDMSITVSYTSVKVIPEILFTIRIIYLIWKTVIHDESQSRIVLYEGLPVYMAIYNYTTVQDELYTVCCTVYLYMTQYAVWFYFCQSSPVGSIKYWAKFYF